MEINNIISKIAKDIYPEVVKIRRHVHKYPELSFKEFETAKYIKSNLKKFNISFDESFGKNAVIGIIQGKKEGENIALRADIDALNIQEKIKTEYKSRNNGVMHACGHDVHTASLIGTGIILNNLKQYIKGKIILIFQPAEELDPGGAKILIEKGLLKKYSIKKILGQHVLPGLKTGYFGFTPGKSMAATNELYIKFTGKGGHAAIPSLRSDTVLAVSSFINIVKDLPAKYSKKEAPVIVAFGKIMADGAINIVPSESIAEGTMRTFDEKIRRKIKKEIAQIANDCAEKYNCKAEIDIKDGYPYLSNDIALTKELIYYAKDFLSDNQIVLSDMRMTGEDFAYFSQLIPASYYRMGIAGNNKGNENLHSEYFDIDEKALKYSTALMAYLAIKINE